MSIEVAGFIVFLAVLAVFIVVVERQKPPEIPRPPDSSADRGDVASVEQLIAADSSLTRSFAAFAVLWLVGILWQFVVAAARPAAPASFLWMSRVLAIVQIAAQVWYATSAARAATMVGETSWHYATAILLLPLPGLVGPPSRLTMIGASPLSIKFLLSGRLQTAVRDASFAEMRQG